MALLNPILLWCGIAGVSVPIIIHLLNRRKFQRVVWAAMRFLNLAVEQNQRRIQIEDLLLLILRCLLVLLLGLALARPALRAANAAGVFGQAHVEGVIIIDDSYSMSATDGVKSRFDQAKSAAEQVMDTLPAGSRMGLIFASDIANKVIPEPTYDLNLVRKTIREARLTDRSTKLYESIRAGLEMLKGRSALRKEVYLFTDGQRLGWGEMTQTKRAIADAGRAGEDIRTHIVMVGSPEDENLGVSKLTLDTDWAMVGTPLRFNVEVTNYGKSEAHDVHLKIRVDDDPPSDEATIDAIPSKGSKTIALNAKLRDSGFHTITASLPPDHLPADDDRTIAVHGIDKLRVLLVSGQAGRTPQEDETYFLKQILLPVPPAQQDQYFIKVTQITASDLANTHLDDFDAVVLADVADLPQATLDALANYLRHGRGGLMVFPGPNTLVSFYNEQLVKKYHFLPASLGTPVGDADQDANYIMLQEKAFQHPISEIWNAAGAGSPSYAHFFRVYPLIPDPVFVSPAAPGALNSPASVAKPPTAPVDQFAAEAGRPRDILDFGQTHGNFAGGNSLNGQPAIMERTWGQGRVILFSSTASTRWNDLAVAGRGGVFAPLIYRSLGSLVQRQDDALNMLAGSGKFVYRFGEDYLGKDAMIYKPGQDRRAADVRRIELGEGGNVPMLTYDQTDLAGAYTVSIADPPTTLKFAVQRDPNESDLDPLTDDQIKSLREVAHVVQWAPGTSMAESIEKERVGTELWLPLAFIVALLACAETFLAPWFSRVK